MVALTPATCEEIGLQLSEEDKKRPFVELSGRKGLGVKADELLDALIRKELSELRARHDLEPEEASLRARIIAVGALRYFLVRFARNTLIAFDFKEALNFEGETGPYVQYAVVRADSIFRKFAQDGGKAEIAAEDVDYERLSDLLASSDDIWELIYFAARMPEAIRQVAQSQEVSHLAKYAFYLAQKFNLFYHKHRILSESDEIRKMCLLFVVDIVRKQLSKALDLLGCEVPPMM
jgi:arginyl-tRNA synthetase